MARFIRAKSNCTLLERQKVGQLEDRGCVDSGKEVTEAKGESSATACCSPGCKSSGPVEIRRKGKKYMPERGRACLSSLSSFHIFLWVQERTGFLPNYLISFLAYPRLELVPSP